MASLSGLFMARSIGCSLLVQLSGTTTIRILLACIKSLNLVVCCPLNTSNIAGVGWDCGSFSACHFDLRKESQFYSKIELLTLHGLKCVTHPNPQEIQPLSDIYWFCPYGKRTSLGWLWKFHNVIGALYC